MLSQQKETDLLRRAATIQRRISFCEKEQASLKRRYSEIEASLTPEQKEKLSVKLEDEAALRSINSEKNNTIIIDDNDSDDDVVFVMPDDYTPAKKKPKPSRTVLGDITNTHVSPDSTTAHVVEKDLQVLFSKPAINFPHAREHCKIYKFFKYIDVKKKCLENAKTCEQCYCFVCDKPVIQCTFWTVEGGPHCNAYAKLSFWEKEKILAKVNCPMLISWPINELPDAVKDAVLETKQFIQDVSIAIADQFKSNSCDCYCHEEGRRSCFECDCRSSYDSDDDEYGYWSDWTYSRYSDRSNIPSGPSYGVYISQLIRHARRCSHYEDFRYCHKCLVDRLLSQGYRALRLEKSFKKFYGRYQDLIEKYQRSSFLSTIKTQADKSSLKVKEFLREKDPTKAAILIDSIASLILNLDYSKNSDSWNFHTDIIAIINKLEEVYMDIFLDETLPSNMYSLLKDHLKEGLQNAHSSIKEQAQKLKSALEMKPSNDPAILKILQFKAGDATPEEVLLPESATTRTFNNFKEKKRFNEALNFAAFVKTGGDVLQKRACDLFSIRKELPAMLLSCGKIYEAIQVIQMSFNKSLPPEYLFPGETVIAQPEKSSSFDYNCNGPIKDLTVAEFQGFINIMCRKMADLPVAREQFGSLYLCGLNVQLPSANSLKEDTVRYILLFAMRAFHVNYSLSMGTMEWLFKYLFPSYAKREKPDLNDSYRKLQDNVFTLVMQTAQSRCLKLSDLECAQDNAFKDLVLEILCALTVSLSQRNSYNSIRGIIEFMKAKDVLWPAFSLNYYNEKKGRNSVDRAFVEFLIRVITNTISTDWLVDQEKTFGRWISSSEISLRTLIDLVKALVAEDKAKVSGDDKNASFITQRTIDIARKVKKEIFKFPGYRGGVSLKEKDHMKLMDDLVSVFTGPDREKFTKKSTETLKAFAKFRHSPNCHTYKFLKSRCSKGKWEKIGPKCILTIKDTLKRAPAETKFNLIELLIEEKMMTEVKTILSSYQIVTPQICEKITTTLTKIQKTNIEAAKDMAGEVLTWLPKSIADEFRNSSNVSVCGYSRYYRAWKTSQKKDGQYRISDQFEKCLNFLHYVDPVKNYYVQVLDLAITNVESRYDSMTVSSDLRTDLVKWLKNIKRLYLMQHKGVEWRERFKKLCNGRLKRKSQVIRELRSSNLGSIPSAFLNSSASSTRNGIATHRNTTSVAISMPTRYTGSCKTSTNTAATPTNKGILSVLQTPTSATAPKVTPVSSISTTTLPASAIASHQPTGQKLAISSTVSSTAISLSVALTISTTSAILASAATSSSVALPDNASSTNSATVITSCSVPLPNNASSTVPTTVTASSPLTLPTSASSDISTSVTSLCSSVNTAVMPAVTPIKSLQTPVSLATVTTSVVPSTMTVTVPPNDKTMTSSDQGASISSVNNKLSPANTVSNRSQLPSANSASGTVTNQPIANNNLKTIGIAPKGFPAIGAMIYAKNGNLNVPAIVTGYTQTPGGQYFMQIQPVNFGPIASLLTSSPMMTIKPLDNTPSSDTSSILNNAITSSSGVSASSK